MVLPANQSAVPTNNPVSVPTYQPAGRPSPFVFPGVQRLKINPRLNPVYCFGNLVEGYILESWANPVEVLSIKAKSPVNQSLEQELEPEEGVDYVNAYYLCECAVDLNDKLNMTGNQEIRLGRSYYLKSVDIEFSGYIISMEKIEG